MTSSSTADWCLCASAVVIGRRLGVEWVSAFRPDEHERTAPAVDLVLSARAGGRELAMEHTILEPFPRHIEDAIQHLRLLADLPAMVARKLPARGLFQLSTRPGDILGLPAAQRQVVVPRLADWVVMKAPGLVLASGQHVCTGHFVSAVPPETPFPVMLCRWDMPPHGELHVIEHTDGVWRDTSFRDRLKKALDEKLPKLAQEKSRGRLTALVLERIDIAYLNEPVIAAALKDECHGRSALLPDYIALAETGFARDVAWLYLIKEGSAWSPAIDEASVCLARSA